MHWLAVSLIYLFIFWSRGLGCHPPPPPPTVLAARLLFSYSGHIWERKGVLSEILLGDSQKLPRAGSQDLRAPRSATGEPAVRDSLSPSLWGPLFFLRVWSPCFLDRTPSIFLVYALDLLEHVLE